MRVILASSSLYRRELIARLGLECEAVDPRYEEIQPADGSEAGPRVLANARGKARSLLADHPDALVIGSDQVAVCAHEVLLKPGSPERARCQLAYLSGREHTLLTAVAVIGHLRHPQLDGSEDGAPAPDRPARGPRGEWRLVQNTLRLRTLTSAEIDAYVAREHPVDCAGSYKSEGLGIALFEYLRGDDPTAIVGLPLIALCDLLRLFGLNPLTMPGAGSQAGYSSGR